MIMPTVYVPRGLATAPNTSGTGGAMWLAFSVLCDKRHPPLMEHALRLCLRFVRGDVPPPRLNPAPLPLAAPHRSHSAHRRARSTI